MRDRFTAEDYQRRPRPFHLMVLGRMMLIGMPRVFLTNSATDVIGFGMIVGSLTGPDTWKYAATSLPVPAPIQGRVATKLGEYQSAEYPPLRALPSPVRRSRQGS